MLSNLRTFSLSLTYFKTLRTFTAAALQRFFTMTAKPSLVNLYRLADFRELTGVAGVWPTGIFIYFCINEASWTTF